MHRVLAVSPDPEHSAGWSGNHERSAADDGIAVLNRIEVCDTGNQALLTVAVAIINGKAPFITSLLGRLIIVFITDLQIRPALRQRLIGVLRRGRSELFDR